MPMYFPTPTQLFMQGPKHPMTGNKFNAPAIGKAYIYPTDLTCSSDKDNNEANDNDNDNDGNDDDNDDNGEN